MHKPSRAIRHFELDPARYPVVVCESDDWGACEIVPRPCRDEYHALLKRHGHQSADGVTLETAAELTAVQEVLGSVRGRDGFPAVFTAFTCMGNPDFAAIAASDFRTYHDIPLGQGFPSPWDGTGVLEQMHQGCAIGVWEPEYHSMLHHTSPKLWLELLRGTGPDAELARDLFQLNAYYQLRHLPEYHGYDIREQHDMICTGFARFTQLFGHRPSAAVSSDAYPETELLWAAAGARAICLKNCRVNSGEIVVYPNKPWNMQDVYARLGDCDPLLNATFLTRNVFMEYGHSSDDVLQAVTANFTRHREPAVISTHRANYCGWNPGRQDASLERLHTVLTTLSRNGAIFLTSGELADLYRQGWSCRRFNRQCLLRKWFDSAIGPDFIADLPAGDHLLAPATLPPDFAW